MQDSRPSSKDEAPRRTAQPYLDWALATRFSYLREGDWIPLLIEFDAQAARTPGNERLSALEAFATRQWLQADLHVLDEQFVIPELFTAAPALLKNDSNFNFCVALIRRDVDVVRGLTDSERWNRTIVRLELGPPIDFARKSRSAPPSPGPIPVAVQQATPLPARSHTGFVGRAKARIRRAVDWIASPFSGARRKKSTEGAMPAPPAPTPPPSPPPSPPGSPSPPANPGLHGKGPSPATPPPVSSGGSAAGGSAHQIGRVVIAVIDQGIAFTNSRFFTAGAPRIEYLWQQNVLGTVVPGPALTMPFTPGFELDRVAIQNAVAAAKPVGASEDWIYQNFGGLSFAVDGYKPLAHRKTHGTHVLDVAAGDMATSQHPIIAVDMPEDAVGDPAGSTLSVQAAWGLIYILDRAAQLQLLQPNETLPVVANLSYGPHEGPHDGTALLEDFMDRIWQMAKGSSTPLEIVLAAGNSRQTRTHATFDLRAAKRKNLRWRLQPGSLSASLMEIWLPPGGGLNVTVTLTPPFTSAALPPVSVSPTKLIDRFSVGANEVYSARYVPATTSASDSIVLSIARTAPDPAGAWGDAVARSGVWRVTLKSATAVQGLESWIRRSDTLSDRRAKGRQSYFDDPKYTRFGRTGRPDDFDPTGATSYVKRVQTLSGIATGQRTRVIGGYRNSDFYPAFYSSHGTRTLGGIPTGPDWLTCCDESDVLLGVHAAGTRSGSVVAMNGTSAAAPQATRWIATEWLGTGTRPGLPPGLSPPPVVPPTRPIPPGELPFAFGNGLAAFKPRWPPRREI